MFGKFLAAFIILVLIIAGFWGGVVYLGSVAWENRSEISKSAGEAARDVTDGVKEGFNKK